jgi:ComF family protein
MPVLPQIVRDLADFLYPGRCAVCGNDCLGADFLCHQCDGGLENLAAESACDRCALPVVSRGAPCPWCRGRGLHPFDRIARLGKFADPLRTLIHSLKYHRRWVLAHQLAGRLAEQPQVRQILKQADVLVPVPLHWTRHIGRGYNQSELLARALAGHCGAKVVRAVRRIRHTASQTSMHSRTVREENVHGAFALKSGRGLAGKRLVVVDDVMTTAATIQAVGRVLKAVKPDSISAIVVAVADPKGRDFEAI